MMCLKLNGAVFSLKLVLNNLGVSMCLITLNCVMS